MTTKPEIELLEEIERMEAKMIEDAKKDETELFEEHQRLVRLVNTLSREESEVHVKAFVERNRAKLQETIDQKIAITEAKKKYIFHKLKQLNGEE